MKFTRTDFLCKLESFHKNMPIDEAWVHSKIWLELSGLIQTYALTEGLDDDDRALFQNILKEFYMMYELRMDDHDQVN